MAKPDQLSNQIALVTGGGQGLGAAVVKEFASLGIHVYSGDIQPQSNSSPNVSPIILDVRSESDIRDHIKQIVKNHGHLDIVVNNAGIDFTKPVVDMTMSEWDQVIAVNLRGSFLVSRAALKVMYRQEHGNIFNITSTAAKRAWKNASAYHATKWGLLGFSHALFTEARDHQVKVTAIIAGGMRTPFILDRFPEINPLSLQDPQNVAKVISSILLVSPESVIPEIMILPLNESSWP